MIGICQENKSNSSAISLDIKTLMQTAGIISASNLAMGDIVNNSQNGEVVRGSQVDVPDVDFRGDRNTKSSSDPAKRKLSSIIRSHVSVIILCFINLINYMDRYTIAGVLKDVKSFYNIDNSEGGLLLTVFVCSYMVFAPVFGYLGDRYSRKIIITFGILMWSATTLCGSFIPADNFWAFLVLRGLVGVGEASYSTLAPTIISDLYVGKQRSIMLTIFYFAIPAGSGLGYIISSAVAKGFGNWQWSLRITPALGVVATILLFIFMKEPPRGEAEGGTHLTATDWKTDLKYLWKNRTFIWSTMGFTAVAFVIGSLAWWAPYFMTFGYEVQGIDSSNVEFIFGAITCFAGVFGVGLGYIISKALKTKYPNADALVCGFGMIIGTPFLFISAMTADKNIYVSWVMIFIGEVFFCMNWPLVADLLLYCVIPTRRGIAEAVQMVSSHALGDAFSPYIIGAVSDALKNGQTPSNLVKFTTLRNSLFITTFISLFGGLFFLIAAIYVVRDKDRATKIVSGNNGSESICEDLSPVVIRADDVCPLVT